MKMPWYQRLLLGCAVILAGFVALGEVVDSAGAANSLISPQITYYGTAGVILVLVTAQVIVRWKRPKFLLGSTLLPITRLGRDVYLTALGFIALLWIPRLFDSPPSNVAVEYDFPIYDSGIRDLKGAYFANGPIRLIDAIVLGDPQFGRYDVHNTMRTRTLRVRDGASILVSIFFYNSATDPALRDTTRVRDARVSAWVDTVSNTVHQLSAGIAGGNTKAVYSTSPDRGGNVVVTSTEHVRLTYVPGSTFACVHRPPVFERHLPNPADPTGICKDARRGGAVQLIHLPDGIVNGTTRLGRIPGQLSGFVVFRLNVSVK